MNQVEERIDFLDGKWWLAFKRACVEFENSLLDVPEIPGWFIEESTSIWSCVDYPGCGHRPNTVVRSYDNMCKISGQIYIWRNRDGSCHGIIAY
jgi:hypothetical protein